jgi:hypothetical protein
MLIFWRERLVLLATPKTASTALESVLAPHAAIVILRPPQLKHTNAQRYQRFLAPFLGDKDGLDFPMTALMREPRDWLGSWYRYRRRRGEQADKSTRHLSFDDFVRCYCQTDQPEFAKVGSQANFLAPKGHRPVDHIFRYETMPAFVAFLQHRLSVQIDLPRINVSPKAELTLSPVTQRLLREFCARDFELYADIRATS